MRNLCPFSPNNWQHFSLSLHPLIFSFCNSTTKYFCSVFLKYTAVSCLLFLSNEQIDKLYSITPSSFVTIPLGFLLLCLPTPPSPQSKSVPSSATSFSFSSLLKRQWKCHDFIELSATLIIYAFFSYMLGVRLWSVTPFVIIYSRCTFPKVSKEYYDAIVQFEIPSGGTVNTPVRNWASVQSTKTLDAPL